MIELREALQAQVAALREHAPLMDPDGDPEELHKLRVAVRRLRALLRAARPLIDDERAATIRGELGELGGKLGPARDLDVFLAYLRNEAASLDGDAPVFDSVLDDVDRDRRAAYAAARETLASPDHARLIEELEAFCANVVIRDGSLKGVVARELRRFRKAAKRVETDEELHAARVHAKRVRYAAEAAGKRKLVERMKRLQDAGGEHQDAVVAEERLRALARPETALVVGRLVERQEGRRQRARKAWAKLT